MIIDYYKIASVLLHTGTLFFFHKGMDINSLKKSRLIYSEQTVKLYNAWSNLLDPFINNYEYTAYHINTDIKIAFVLCYYYSDINACLAFNI